MIIAPIKVSKRITSQLRRYQRILSTAKKRDYNEADTVRIVENILSDVLGYELFNEITSEYKIRNQYCDIAIRINDKVHYLIEVKAIGLSLKATHLKQVLHYASDEGVDWILLTNGHIWEAYRVLFRKPIEHQKIFSLDLLNIKPSDKTVIEKLYIISREGIAKSVISDYHKEKQAMSRYNVASILFTEPILKTIRRELRKKTTGTKIDLDALQKVLALEVIKREVVEQSNLKGSIKKLLA